MIVLCRTHCADHGLLHGARLECTADRLVPWEPTDGRFEKQKLNKTNGRTFALAIFRKGVPAVGSIRPTDLLPTQDTSISLSTALLQPK
jgi:hypothetical protein